MTIHKLGITLAALSLVGTVALAQSNQGLIAGPAATSRDSLPGAYTPPPQRPAGLVTIFSNLATKYPKSLYFCCYSYSVEGPNSGGHELWDAEAFTPASDQTVTRIEIAITLGAGTNEAVVAIYNDNSGVPGTALKTWHVTNLSGYNTCCDLAVLKDNAGIPLTAGHQYWVVLKTDSTNKDSGIQWHANTSDQIDSMPFAQYCSNDAGGPTCSTTNDAWQPDGSVIPGLALGVFGH